MNSHFPPSFRLESHAGTQRWMSCISGMCFGMSGGCTDSGGDGRIRKSRTGMLLIRALKGLRASSSIHRNSGDRPSANGGLPRLHRPDPGRIPVIRMLIRWTEPAVSAQRSSPIRIQEVPTLSDCGERRTVRRSSHRGRS